VKFHE
jgi:hypothetical protein